MSESEKKMPPVEFKKFLQRFIAFEKDAEKHLKEKGNLRDSMGYAPRYYTAGLQAEKAREFLAAMKNGRTPGQLAAYAGRELARVASTGGPHSSDTMAETEMFAVMQFYGSVVNEVHIYEPVVISLRTT